MIIFYFFVRNWEGRRKKNESRQSNNHLNGNEMQFFFPRSNSHIHSIVTCRMRATLCIDLFSSLRGIDEGFMMKLENNEAATKIGFFSKFHFLSTTQCPMWLDAECKRESNKNNPIPLCVFVFFIFSCVVFGFSLHFSIYSRR